MSDNLRIIDFHSHILPCADHGSDGINTTRKQISLMNNAGVDTAVLTPHFYPDRHSVSNFTDEINAAAEELIDECKVRPRICIGAEILYCDGIEYMENINKLCIKGTNILLLELPLSPLWHRSMIYEIKRMATKYTIVLAHIDRYVEDHSTELLWLLSTDGIYAQINTSAISKKKRRRALIPYIEDGYVCALGSDLHGSPKKTYRRFTKAKKLIGDDRYSKIMTHTAEILKDATLI